MRHGWLALAASLFATCGRSQAPPSPEPPAPSRATLSDAEFDAHGDAGALQTEIERERAFLERLEAFRDAEEKRERAASAQAHEALARALALRRQSERTAAGGADADRLYGRIGGELQDARGRLRDALDAWGRPGDVPGDAPAADLGALAELAAPAQLDELRDLQGRVAATRADLRARERERRWSNVEAQATRVRRLETLRRAAFERLSSSRRARLLSLTPDGLEQLGGELERVGLGARHYAAAVLRDAARLPARPAGWPDPGTATGTLLRLAAVIAAALYLRAHGAALHDGVRRLLFSASSGVQAARRSDLLLGALRSVAPWALFLAGIAGARWALGALAAAEIDLLLDVALLYGAYRLGLDALMGFVLSAARRHHLVFDAARRSRLLRGARLLARALFAAACLLFLARRLAGPGQLSHLAQRAAWIVILAAVLRALLAWREAIADSFLAARPTGRRAALVRATRGRWFGVPVAGLALVWLAGRALGLVARDFAMGFAQTRRAMAFIFRWRLEKEAEREGQAPDEDVALPAALVAAFTEAPVTGGPLVIDNFPGTELLATAFERWRDGRGNGAFLLTGERGIGKTTWLDHVELPGLAAHRVSLTQRAAGAQEVARVFARQSGAPAALGDDIEALGRALLDGPPRLLTVDLAQNLFVAAVGGYAAFEAFVRLVEATSRRVFWICAMNTHAWEHLSAARPDLAVFRLRQALPPWSEEQIRELIRARAAASGMTFSYQDGLVGPLDGVAGEARVLETEEGYTRLLWDFSGGNPRVALHYWLRSLVREGPDRARVRLPKLPSPDELTDLGETALLLLAAVVIHENLTIEEAVRTTRFGASVCRGHVERLVELEALQADDGRYRLTAHWHGVAVRLLKRRNLLPA